MRFPLLIAVLVATYSSVAIAKTIYSGAFDYKKIEPPSKYFAGHSRAQILEFCKTGNQASTTDLSECSQMEFEDANRELQTELSRVTSKIKENDKRLATEGEPQALPYFEKSQRAWSNYRDNECYTQTYSLGEASIRYITFWDCMASITQKRVNELKAPPN